MRIHASPRGLAEALKGTGREARAQARRVTLVHEWMRTSGQGCHVCCAAAVSRDLGQDAPGKVRAVAMQTHACMHQISINSIAPANVHPCMEMHISASLNLIMPYRLPS